MSSEHYKSGFVALLGRPNVGKSSIINALLGEKVAAVSPKPQTTRNAVRCIYTTDKEQIIFVDTPGIHTPKHALGDFMMKEAEEALMQVDAICYVVEAQDRAVSEKDRVILEALSGVKLPIVLAVNKTDKLTNAADYTKSAEVYAKQITPAAAVPVSAAEKRGLEELASAISAVLPEQPAICRLLLNICQSATDCPTERIYTNYSQIYELFIDICLGYNETKVCLFPIMFRM